MRELDEKDISDILDIVEGLALDAADGDTSIPEERLAGIMAAVRYCIAEGETCLGEVGENALMRHISADELYRIGYDSIVGKVSRVLKHYNEVATTFCDYGYRDLGRTFREEIPDELSRFDPRFEPDAEVVFSYPMPRDDGRRLGVDAIVAAVERIGAEQEFLARLDGHAVTIVATEAAKSGMNLLEMVAGR